MNIIIARIVTALIGNSTIRSRTPTFPAPLLGSLLENDAKVIEKQITTLRVKEIENIGQILVDLQTWIFRSLRDITVTFL